MPPAKRVLVVAPDFGVERAGVYRPGGLELFSRSVFHAMASAPGLERVDGLSLLDDVEGAKVFTERFSGKVVGAPRVRVRGFAGDRHKMAVSYLARSGKYDLAMFTHIGIGRLSVLRPDVRTSLWLVGVEVRRPLAWYERRAVRRARPLLSISSYSTEEMLRYNPELPSAATVHLCGEPPAPGAPADAIPSAAYDPAQRDRAVLIVGRLAKAERYKGHDQLIDAWPSVVESCPGAALWIVGTGDDEPRLRGRCAALAPSVASSIRFFGRLSREDLDMRYRRARVFAMPSTGEGFGLVFVEAMRLGLPCICSRDSAKEVVEDGVTGLVAFGCSRTTPWRFGCRGPARPASRRSSRSPRSASAFSASSISILAS